MTQISPKVLNWLHTVLADKYQDVQRTYSEVAHILSAYPSLQPRTSVYVSDRGASSLLLHLHGTLPVTFRASSYWIPVSIWMPQSYPREGPMAYVTPSGNMAVRPGQYISGEGRVYHPYLASWQPDKSNLGEFLSILRQIFSREPPVITKTDQTRALSDPRANGHGPPVPPLPPKPGGPESQGRSTPQDNPPPPPPKPFNPESRTLSGRSNNAPPIPPYGGSETRSPQPSDYPRNTTLPHPPKPDQYTNPMFHSLRDRDISPNIHDSRVDGPQYRDAQSSVPIYQSTIPQGPPRPPETPQGRYQNPPPPPSSSHPQRPPYHPDPNSQPRPQSYNSYPPQPPYSQQTPYPQQPPYPQNHHAQPPQPKKPIPPPDLLDTPLEPQPSSDTNPQPTGPPPPRPPNPEKDHLLSLLSHDLAALLHQHTTQNNSRLAPLQSQSQALQNTLRRMQTESQSLTSLSTLLASNESILHTAMHDADNVIANAKHRSVPGVDEVLVAPTVVGEQIYGLVAEERACGEARAVLARGLDGGRVGVEVWGKGTRGLAREEFLKKVLIRKAGRGMGLGGLEKDSWKVRR